MKGFKEFRKEQQDLVIDESLVASDLNILDTILNKIKDDIVTSKVNKEFEKSWPKMQALSKLAGYGISKKKQAKGKT